MAQRVGLMAWVDEEHLEVLQRLRDEGHLELVAVGSPVAAVAARLAKDLGVEKILDVRTAAGRGDVDVLWLAASEPLEAAERRAVRDAPARVIANAPVPAAIADLLADAPDTVTADFAPLMRRSPGFLAARDLIEELGETRCLAATFASGPGEGPLLARLFDAVDLVENCFGSVEAVDAALVAPVSGPPETLLGLRGYLTLNLRFGDRRCATVAVADGAGAWHRQVTLLSDAGALRIDDGSYAWQPRGGTAELSEVAAPPGYAALLGAHVRRVLEQRDHEAPADARRLLSLCEAARLSCRTGQGETPSRMLEISSRL